ncbi:MAG: hemolysin family protein [Acidimicrobiia bacterium]|nr:hemolysin family protein [Acidimicrobiia bacterium]
MTTVALVASLIMLVINGLLRAAGASLVRTPRADAVHDAADGDARAGVVAELLDDRPRIQPALGIFHAGLMVLSAIPATWALAALLSGFQLLVSFVILAVILVALGDVMPRGIGRSRPAALAYRFSRLLSLAIALGDAATDLIIDEEPPVEADSEEEADADAEEKVLISSVLEFTDTIVREVMIPRTDMISIDGEASTDAALDLVLAEGRSRIPVLGDGPDDIVGVLYARDLLQLMDDEAAAVPCRKIMRPAYFVPETKRVSELLRDMQSNQVHLGIVVDEFGGTAGLVTIEDLLEEIVGEIVDEYDHEEEMVTALEGGGFLVDGRLGVDELGEILGVELPDDEWDTVGGLMLGLAGRVPREGESFELDGHVLTAERVQGRRVAQVRLTER